MNISEAQTEFLNIFPSQHREHIIEFAKLIQSIDADVLVFTARKAVCFFNCLEYLQIWQNNGKIIVSERIKDHDLRWISGKRIAIIDELIVTGTNIYKLTEALIKNGASSVSIYALYINNNYFVPALFKDVPINGFISLDNIEAQAFGTTIVRSMQRIPRPYAVDYPISLWSNIEDFQFIRLLNSSEWEIKQTFSEIPSNTLVADSEIAYYSLNPIDSNFILSQIGLGKESKAMIKIRIYGRWFPTSIENNKKSLHYRIVPYFVADPMEELSLNELFHKLMNSLPDDAMAELAASCTTTKAKLRVINYIFANKVGNIWADSIKLLGIPAEYNEDLRERSYLFPSACNNGINYLSHKPVDVSFTHDLPLKRNISKLLYITNEKIDYKPMNQSLKDNYRIKKEFINQSSLLLRPFVDMYLKWELPFRKLVKRLGVEALTNQKYNKLANRLEMGFSWKELSCYLREFLPPIELSSKSLLIFEKTISDFVDVAIDNGWIVPITALITSIDGKSTIACRAYRHGEETYLLCRDRTIFRAMLESYYQLLAKYSIIYPKAIRGMYSKGNSPKLIIEKILILFFRYSLADGIFDQTFSGEGARGGRIRVRVGYDLHGARLAVDKELPTEISLGNGFVDWLVKERVLIKNEAGFGYRLGNGGRDQDGYDKGKMAKAIAYGSLMAEIVHKYLVMQLKSKDMTEPSKLLNNSLVALTTCETVSSTILAIGAEFRHVIHGLSKQSLEPNIDPKDLLPFISAKGREYSKVKTAINSAYLKSKLYFDKEWDSAAQIIENLLSQSEIPTQSLWALTRIALDKKWSRSKTVVENHFLVNLLDNIIQFELELLFFEYYVLRVNSKILPTYLRRKLKEFPIVIEEKFIEIDNYSQLLNTKQQPIYKAAAEKYSLCTQIEKKHYSELCKKPDQEALSEVLTNLASIQADLAAYIQIIDNSYNERGELTPYKTYSSSLHIEALGLSSEIIISIRDLLMHLHELFLSNNKNRDNPDYIFREYKINETNAKFDIFASGENANAFLGFATGMILNLQNREINQTKIGALIDINLPRRAFIGIAGGKLIVPVFLQGAIDKLISIATQQNSVCILQTHLSTNQKSIDAFIIELNNCYVDRKPIINEPVLFDGKELGGETKTWLLHKTEKISRPLFAFIFTVPDELQSYLNYLHQNNIEPAIKPPTSTHKQEWRAIHKGKKGEFEVVALLNREQGSTDAGILIEEVHKSYHPKAIFLIGISAILNLNSNYLGDVNVPIRVLDAQQTVATPDEILPNNFDRPLSVKVRELIQSFFAEKVHLDKLINSEFGDITGKLRMNTIMSDNALLRDDTPSERHRAVPKTHSYKVDAYDKESAGVAGFLEHNPEAIVLIVKGFSDKGTPNKKDKEIRFVATENSIIVALNLASYILSMPWPKESIT